MPLHATAQVVLSESLRQYGPSTTGKSATGLLAFIIQQLAQLPVEETLLEGIKDKSLVLNKANPHVVFHTCETLTWLDDYMDKAPCVGSGVTGKHPVKTCSVSLPLRPGQEKTSRFTSEHLHICDNDPDSIQVLVGQARDQLSHGAEKRS